MTGHINDIESKQAVAKWLAKGALRPTKQRMILAQHLIGDGNNRHVTAESLFKLSNDQNHKVSLATVYNTLHAFCEAGLMREITIRGSKSYFDTNMTDHPHFYWEDTTELIDASPTFCHLYPLPELPPKAVITKIDVVIRLRRK